MLLRLMTRLKGLTFVADVWAGFGTAMTFSLAFAYPAKLS